MPLSVGTRLGPYEIQSPLGAGGMGEVYRATDTKLKRQVAIKILPPSLATDPERLARFQREAEVLAALNHPNIATIYGLERQEGQDGHTWPFLVMELVEGPTLADRIAQGPVPVDEALPIAKQIAEALEAAHEQGIIHRDLKPANIKVRPDGAVKVLDFGLAKLVETPGSGLQASDVSHSPTITSPAGMTGVGVLLGTAAYMSPEQAKGRPADKRSDIWAFGCVLYEMIAGKRAFEGDDVSDTLAAVLRGEPEWTALPPHIPASIRHLLQRCLQKDRKRRLADMADARLEIEDPMPAPDKTVPVVAASRTIARAAPWIAALVFLATSVALAVLFLREAPADEQSAVRFSFETPATRDNPNNVAISPNGRHVAYAGFDENGRRLLWLRSLDDLISRPLAGTEGGLLPFWSPDSRFIGFFADGRLKKVDILGGLPQTLCDTQGTFGGTWNGEGVILFGGTDGLHRVAGAGGTPSLVTKVDAAHKEVSHVLPEFLPDGRYFVYLARGLEGGPGIYLGTLDATGTSRLMQSDTKAEYVEPGYLLFIRGSALLAQQFDATRRELVGEPSPVAEQVGYSQTGQSGFSASDTGTLVYRPDSGTTSRLTWFDRSGKELGSIGDPNDYETMQLSPDEGIVAVGRRNPQTRPMNLWLIDLRRNVSSRLTFGTERESNPAWSPDGRRIAFNSTRKGVKSLYDMASTGGNEVPLMQGGTLSVSDRSKDGRFLLFNNELTRDLFALPLSGERTPILVVHPSLGLADQPNFSADGKWIAYNADESGRAEVYVTPFPPTGEKWQISSAGGVQPRWRADGRELYYLAVDGTMMAVDVSLVPRVQPGTPRPLFRTGLAPRFNLEQFAVTRDGQRFLVMKPLADATSSSLTVVLNWSAALNRADLK